MRYISDKNNMNEKFVLFFLSCVSELQRYFKGVIEKIIIKYLQVFYEVKIFVDWASLNNINTPHHLTPQKELWVLKSICYTTL